MAHIGATAWRENDRARTGPHGTDRTGRCSLSLPERVNISFLPESLLDTGPAVGDKGESTLSSGVLMRGKCFCTFAAAVVIGAVPVLAQFDSGQISGFIRDPSQSSIASANVVVTNEGNGEKHRTTTNS